MGTPQCRCCRAQLGNPHKMSCTARKTSGRTFVLGDDIDGHSISDRCVQCATDEELLAALDGVPGARRYHYGRVRCPYYGGHRPPRRRPGREG